LTAGGEQPGSTAVAELEATATTDDAPLPDRIPESTQLVASSGSTGSPKLIAVPARGVVGGDEEASVTRGQGDGTMLVVSPLHHVNGFAFAAPTLLEGKRVVVMEHFDAAQAVSLIEAHRVTHTVMVPTMLQRIARLEGVTRRHLASLERVVYGGATIPGWVVDRWLELIPPKRFIFAYGSSERLVACKMTGDDWPKHRGSSGRPLDAEVKVLGPEGHELAAGQVGDLYFKPHTGRPLFHYIGREMPRPTPDGFMTLGDVGYVDLDSYVYIVDRRQDMIITGGANVLPAEVEAALSEHAKIADQVVLGVADPEWGRRVHGVVQPVDTTDPPASTSCGNTVGSASLPTRCQRPSRSSNRCPGRRRASSIAVNSHRSESAHKGTSWTTWSHKIQSTW